MLIQALDVTDVAAEEGVLVVRDTRGPESSGMVIDGPLEEFAVGLRPSGSLANAGWGWLHVDVGHRFPRLRIEAHDAPPPWPASPAAAMETPYFSSDGALTVSSLTGFETGPVLPVGRPGHFRVRVAGWPDQLPDSGGRRWLLQFWPVAPPAELSRWFVRSEPLRDLEGVAVDLAATAAWRSGGMFVVDDLADRLQLPSARARAAVRLAVERGLILVHGDVDRSTELRLQVLDAQAQPAADQPDLAVPNLTFPDPPVTDAPLPVDLS